MNNFGIRELLDCFIEIAPAPLARETEERPVRPEEEKFTGFVFKIHANMDPNHRDRIAFVKICSGIFKRNTNYLHVRNGKMLKFSNSHRFMASKKSVIDEAYPGDIIGLHDTGTFKIGDTLTEGEKLHFKGIPSFSPELFKYIENADPMKSKQLAKGIDQLMDEGVAQLFVSQFNNRENHRHGRSTAVRGDRIPAFTRICRRLPLGTDQSLQSLLDRSPGSGRIGRFQKT